MAKVKILNWIDGKSEKIKTTEITGFYYYFYKIDNKFQSALSGYGITIRLSKPFDTEQEAMDACQAHFENFINQWIEKVLDKNKEA